MSAKPPFENHPLFSIDGALATITFNRPDKANAFHPAQTDLMIDFLYEVERRPDVRCVLINANGKHFMAGGDLSFVEEPKSDAKRTSETEAVILRFAHLVRVMHRLKKPVIASVQGGVAGAAVGLVAACDLVIAADTSFYWVAHIHHGGSNDGLVSYFLPRLIGLRRALELALLGERLPAPEAQRLGLINFAVPEGELKAETAKLTAKLCSGPTVGYGQIKRLMYESFGNSMEEQGRLEAELYGEVLHTSDVKDGLKAFFERRPPRFEGR